MNLSDIVQTAAAIRLRQRLLPEGGPGDKVFPPTFAGGVYCWETRILKGCSQLWSLCCPRRTAAAS
jgi:CRISPR-associated protein Csb1